MRLRSGRERRAGLGGALTRRGAPRARLERLAAAALLAAPAAGCAIPRAVRDSREALEAPGLAGVATTNGRNASMIYAAATDSGVIVVDLGWSKAPRALDAALARIGARRGDVAAVLLTHSHRDHVGAWRAVAHARFYVGAAEVPRLFGERAHGGWVPRAADWLRAPALPARGAVRVVPLARDTALAFGRDTVHAFAMPGHTAGSTAYLVRGVLFLGDGASATVAGARLRPPRRGYADDLRAARRSLRRLRAASASLGVRLLCTAHARCAPATPATWRALAGP